MDWNRKKKSKPALILFLFAFSLFFYTCQPEKKNKHPNILLLMSDNHSWNHLGCYGDSAVQTPNIDWVAKHCIK